MHTRDRQRRRRLLGVFTAIAAALALALVLGIGGPSVVTGQQEEYHPSRVLVRYVQGAATADSAQAEADAGAVADVVYTQVPGLKRLKVGPGRTVADTIAALRGNASVLYAEPDYIVHAINTPNDPSFGSLWGMANIHAPLAWDTTTGSSNVVVAIIDTGIDRTHPDLAANIWINTAELNGKAGVDDDGNGYIDDVYGWNFASNNNNPADGNGHGTHTAGTVGAVGNNGIGVVGVNWNVKLAALKFLSDSGSGYTSNAILAVQYATKMGMRVSNNSWGGGGFDQSLYDAINAAKSVGHLFFAAAGNNGTNNDSSAFYPANYTLDNLVSVAAITSTDAKASWSNYGLTTVDIGAPGENILSTVPNNGYAYYSGTSMATPHVAGAAALLLAKNPGWTYSQVRAAILNTARAIPALAGKTVTGGTLDLAAAVAYNPGTTKPAAPTSLNATSPSSTQVVLTWADNSTDESGFGIERLNGSTWAYLASVGVNVKTYTNTGLTASTPYSYRVYAYNAAGSSGYSNTATVTTPAAPPTPTVPPVPTGFKVVASVRLATLSWVDVAGETGYEAGRATVNSRGTCGSLSVFKTLAANVITTTDTRSTGGTYCYAVRAYNTAGRSAWTASVKVTIPRR